MSLILGLIYKALSTISYLQSHGYNPILIKCGAIEDFEARFTPSIKTQEATTRAFSFCRNIFLKPKYVVMMMIFVK